MQLSTTLGRPERQDTENSSPATILVVDDDARDCELLEAALRSQGYFTVIAADARGALAAIGQHAPGLILLDNSSAVRDGRRLITLLKASAATSAIPIILLMAKLDRLSCPGSLEATAQDFLMKPIDRAELFVRVRNQLSLKQFGDFQQNHLSNLEEQGQSRTAELQRFRIALDTTGDAIFLVSRSSMRYVEVNTSATTMLGYTREELLKVGPAQTSTAPIETLERVYDAVIARHPTSELAEVQLLRKDGTSLLVEARRQANRYGDDWLIVSVLRDITERTHAAQQLWESERRFSDMLSNVALISLMLDSKARITYCNDYLLKLTGWRYEEVIGRDWFELFIPPRIHHLRDTFFPALLANQPETLHNENEILTRLGENRLIRWNNTVLRSGTGEVIGTASIGEDITSQKQAETRIKHLNRVYAMLSGITKLIVRVRDLDELYREACRIAVEEGGFLMSLITLVDQQHRQSLPVASAGKDKELMAAIKALLTSTRDAASTMVARAIREKAAVVSNESETDVRVLLRAKYAASGIRSMVVLPLIVLDEAVGVLSLYSSEVGFFQEEELKLLTELASDVAYAIDYIGKQDRLEYLAYNDELTGLANRICFVERVTRRMHSIGDGALKLSIVLIDLERFKNINDSLGQRVGDALLKQVAQWLVHEIGDPKLLARIGADHFAILVPEVRDKENVARYLEKSLESFIDHPFPVNEITLRIAFKAGVAIFPDDGADANTILNNAEAALKKAKSGGHRYLFYAREMTQAVAGRLTLENLLRQALDNEEYVLHYQPKINLLSGALMGAEALIRWNDPRTGLVPPAQFIPLLEETGLIHDVGRWALRKAIEDGLRWRSAGLTPVRIAVNVSQRQLCSRGFVGEIRQVISVDANAAASLELEITESLIMEEVKHSIETLSMIRTMGVTIAIDDFGTGFSSLSYLSKLPVNTLKIDRSFVSEMTTGPQGLSLVSTIIDLAHSLTLNVVAEGVETDEQRRLLQLLRCDQAQGYLFSKPLPSSIFEARYLTQMKPGKVKLL
ncbi:MAG: EAL domain-containing protein [Rudaea sp.]